MHIRTVFSAALLSTLLSGACSESKTEKPAEPAVEPTAAAETSAPAPVATADPQPAPPASHELTDIGYVIETPADWEFKSLGSATYTFGIKAIKVGEGMLIMPSLIITKAPIVLAASTLEAAGKRCSGKLLDTGIAENSAFFHNCETEMAGSAMAGTKILKAEYFLIEGEEVITCSASGLDMETMNKACGSMHKE